jgi:hypothetical protein
MLHLEACIPLERLQPNAISILPPTHHPTTFTQHYAARLPLYPIQYNTVNLSRLCFLTPFAKVIQYDIKSGRLDLSLDGNEACIDALGAFQEGCIRYIDKVLKSSQETIRFQPFRSGTILTVFLSHADSSQKTQYCSPTHSWTTLPDSGQLSPGTQLRVLVKCLGLLSIPVQGGGLRYRLQHNVLAVFSKSC